MVQQWYNNGRLLIKSEILQYDYGNGIIFSIHAIKKGLGLGKGKIRVRDIIKKNVSDYKTVRILRTLDQMSRI